MFLLNVTATTEIYTYCHTLSLHYALPISSTASRILPNSASACAELSQRTITTMRRSGSIQVKELPAPIPKKLDSVTLGKIRRPWFSQIRKRSEEHTSELQSLMRISYAVF